MQCLHDILEVYIKIPSKRFIFFGVLLMYACANN
jgi:hypothetical protein